MTLDTRPAELDTRGDADRWAEFRVDNPRERLGLLRQLCDGSVPVMISTPGGTTLSTTLWALDGEGQRLNFSADLSAPQLADLVEADEAVAVAYLESVKLQFDLQALMLVHGARGSSLQTAAPREIYRFQRRSAYRVRPLGRLDPRALLRHPSMPDMQLALRVLDVSIGGCALWLPADVPPLQAGTEIHNVVLELDPDTRFGAALMLQHVSSSSRSEAGVRLGCEWQSLGGAAQRTLQRWIDGAQKRQRLLKLDNV